MQSKSAGDSVFGEGDSVTTTQKILSAAGAAAIATGIYLASSKTPTNTINPTPTPMPVPYPGFWHEAPNALYYPCNVIPYQIYAQPNDGTPTYVQFEYSVKKVSNTHDVPSGEVNHIPAFYDHLGRIIPIAHSIPGPPDYFPKPTTMMRSNPPNEFPYDAALYWQHQNAMHSPDPPPTEAAYSAAIGNHAEWSGGQFPARMLAKQQQCSQQGPTRTQTPTVVPSVTPVPVVTCVPTVATRLVTVVVTATVTPSFQPAKSPTKMAFDDVRVRRGIQLTKPGELYFGDGVQFYGCLDGSTWAVRTDGPSPCPRGTP